MKTLKIVVLALVFSSGSMAFAAKNILWGTKVVKPKVTFAQKMNILWGTLFGFDEEWF